MEMRYLTQEEWEWERASIPGNCIWVKTDKGYNAQCGPERIGGIDVKDGRRCFFCHKTIDIQEPMPATTGNSPNADNQQNQ